MKGRRYTVCAAILLSGLLLLTGCEKTEGGEISREMPATGEKMKESEVQAKKSGEKNAEEEKAETEEKNGPEETKKDTEVEEAPKTVLQTDIRICIDPGHFGGVNEVITDTGTYYCEGDVTLEIAKTLQKILKEDYGISAYLTRDTETITIDGYSNETLDNSHISLRGKAAQGADLFLSLHTNANLDGANGFDTYFQPVGINKPIIIANQIACQQETALKTGNSIGKNIAQIYRETGLSSQDTFQTNMDGESLLEWSDALNDSLDTPGTICRRTGNNGDYYGVLRGAAEAGVPGFIIEHGFHTVEEVRKQAAKGGLIDRWAEADAKGIAEGFGLLPEEME